MHASAFIAGPFDGPGAALYEIARSLGFAGVFPFESAMGIDRQAGITPICFVLCAAVENIERLRPYAEAVRFSTSKKVRFSPLVYFSETPSLAATQRCIALGFDDVITMPFTARRLADRLARQVGTTLTYYETADYFGPDRRGRLPESTPAHVDGRQGGQFRRLEILRSLTSGVSVLRDDQVQEPMLIV